jgi:preprotein translocase subunit SecF
MRFFSKTNINFIGARKFGFITSGILIAIGIVSMVLHGGLRYNIDFTGGTLVQLKFDKEVKIEDIRQALSEHGYGDSEIKYFGSSNEVVIRAGVEQTTDELTNRFEPIIREALPDNPFVEQRLEKVGPKIGKELIVDFMSAIFWAIVLILFYVMWRFEFKFALGAILALLHDVFITLGIFSLLDIEISAPIIAAVLTIVGYSLNDTIVVFDRIRENIKVKQKDSSGFASIVNKSLNETISRTVITSLTTLLVVTILFFFGGEVLRSFAFALIIGIIIGTYSSIFVASPFVVEWQLRKGSAK